MTTTFGVDPAGSYAAQHPPRFLPDDDLAVDTQLVMETRNQIRTLVQEIAQLSEQDIAASEFYDGLLSRVLSALVATGGAVWSVATPGGPIELAYRVNLEAADLQGARADRHRKLLERVVRDAQPLAAPPLSGFPDNHEAGNPSELLLLLAPIAIDQVVVGVLEIFQRPGAGPTTQRGYLRFLAQMSELTGNFLRNDRLRRFAEREALWQKLERFLHEVHGSLDLQATAYAAVNESRILVDCDRVSLAVADGQRVELLAVSGLDDLTRRSDEAARLERLTAAVIATREPFWHAGDTSLLPPQIENPLCDVVDASHCKTIAIVPLMPRGEAAEATPVGALIFQQMMAGEWTTIQRSRVEAVVKYATPPLLHALQHDQVFLRSTFVWLGRVRARLRGNTRYLAAAIGGGLVALLLALCLIPASFQVSARGTLQPTNRWDIFAPVAGTVIALPVRHGQHVAQGEVLAELSNTEVDVQLTELLGRQRVAHEQLEACRRTLLETSGKTGPRVSVAEEMRLGGEILQLRHTVESVAQEIALVREKQANLVIRAPHGGEVVTWQLEQQLLRRPVQPGQSMLTIVDGAGEWELELRVPERRLKHLDDAASSAGAPSLPVTFMLSTLPGAEFSGRVVEIQRSAEVRGDEGNTVLVRVAFDKERLPPLHSDTTVIAKVDCGRRSLGYVWFCDLIETVQITALFWL